MNIMAIDPGVKTGVVIVKGIDLKSDIPMVEQVKRAIMGDGMGVALELDAHSYENGELGVTDAIMTLMRTWMPTTVLIEDFVLRLPAGSSDRDGLSPVRITARVEYGVHKFHNFAHTVQERRGDGLITRYGASQTKGVITNDRLKRWGLWLVGMQHARDAMRLLLIYLRDKQKGVYDNV